MRKKMPRRPYREDCVSSGVHKMVDAATEDAPGLRPAMYEASASFHRSHS